MDNILRVSPIEGADVLLLNSFKLHIDIPVTGSAVRYYQVTRKGRIIGVFKSPQEAVDWCMND